MCLQTFPHISSNPTFFFVLDIQNGWCYSPQQEDHREEAIEEVRSSPVGPIYPHPRFIVAKA